MAELKVFVVDDEQPIADLLSEFLREDHNDVETFYDAQSVLVRADQCPPDVLVTDISMPDMSGIALARELQDRVRCKVILISGNPEWKCREELPGNGADDFTLLIKPFKIIQLLRLVRPNRNSSTEPSIAAA